MIDRNYESNCEMNKERNCFMELIAAMSMAMDMEENIKLYHGWRCAVFADRIGKTMGIIGDDLFFGGLLHDIGALGVEDHLVHRILNGRFLNDPLIINHPKKGAEILRKLPGMKSVALYVEDHHERWDSQGYPAGKKEDEISLGGQVIMAADLIDLELRRLDAEKVSESFKRFKTFFRPDVFEASMEVLTDISFVSTAADYSNLKPLIDSRIRTSNCFLVDSDIEDTYIEVFADIIDAKHLYTGGHSRRVGEYSQYIAWELNLDPAARKDIYKAALLHDIGKVAVPKRILDAPRRLSDDEFKIIKQHPVHTIELLRTVSLLSRLAEPAGLHHERHDGKGYPLGLKDSEIPLYSKIISLADSLEAITSDRAYQKRRSFEEAAAIIAENRGTQFDPEIAGAALEVIKGMTEKEKIS